jgi:hypothetical protein
MNLKEIQWEVVDWFNLAQDRDKLQDVQKEDNEPSRSIN